MVSTRKVTDHPTKRKARKSPGGLIILTLGLMVGGIFIANWLFPTPFQNIEAQLFSWAARAAALLGSRNIAYLAANQAVVLAPQNVEYLNKRCWYGSLDGDVLNVIDDCHRVVEMEPTEAWAHDTFGVALVFIKDYPGAIREFQFVVDFGEQSSLMLPIIQERKGWLEILKRGENPFDDLALKHLLLQ